MDSVVCDLCNTRLSYKRDLNKHQTTDKCKSVYQFVNTKIQPYKNEIQQLKITINKLNTENNKIKLELSKTIESLKNDKIFLKQENKMLEKSSNEYRKIVEKAATKSTKTINKNNNYTNNYLHCISSEPLKLSELKNEVKSIMNFETVMMDDEDFNDHILKNILKDKNGKDKVLCTDINRKNFTYKDEKSGKLIYDPELEKITEQLRKGANTKPIKNQVLTKLQNDYQEQLESYECEEVTAPEPYGTFTDKIQKLSFGKPFVNHVASKTYHKTKIDNSDNDDNNNINTTEQSLKENVTDTYNIEETDEDNDFDK